MKTIFFFVIAFLVVADAFPQTFKFAFLSDTHIGIKDADEDLRRSVADINADSTIRFVIITGDITEIGSDEEMLLAKNILSGLKKPLYIQTGNHDGNWSANGGRIFNTVFGPGRFAFRYNGYLFIGTNSGPFMHHKAPGQVPREDILWMDSVLNNRENKRLSVIYSNHYPQDSSQRNWFEIIDRLKINNVQLILVGHGHLNTQFNFEGIPGIMGRSNLRAMDTVGSYNIASISNGKAKFEERNPLLKTNKPWAEVQLYQHDFVNDTIKYPRPSYSINESFLNVKEIWNYKDKFDITAGIVPYRNLIIAANTGGTIYALNTKDGKRNWSFQTKGKIFSIPAVFENNLVVASTDSTVYCLNATNGKLIWKCRTARPIVASPTINNGVVYIGSSDGRFSALQLATGKTKWNFDHIRDFVITKPLIYGDKVFFGSWGNEFYALNASDGRLAWKWVDTSENRMFSPAGCHPVATDGKVYIVAPDQYMTSFHASSGSIIWRSKMSSVRVRESQGLSADSSLVYIKTTDGKLAGISTSANEMKAVFNLNLQLGYDICATPVIENNGVIYVPSNSGMLTAVGRQNTKLIWKHKISNSNITSVIPLNNNTIIVSSVDGQITCLQSN